MQSTLMMCCFSFSLSSSSGRCRLTTKSTQQEDAFSVCVHDTEDVNSCICLNGKSPYIMSDLHFFHSCLLLAFSVYRGNKNCVFGDAPKCREEKKGNGEDKQHYSGLVQRPNKSTSKRPCSFFLSLSEVIRELDFVTLSGKLGAMCSTCRCGRNAGACSLMCHLLVLAHTLTFIFLFLAQWCILQHTFTSLRSGPSFFLLLFHLISPFLAPATKTAFWLIKFDKHS